MFFAQNIGICLPPASVSGFLGKRQQLLALVPSYPVVIQQPGDVSWFKAAARQLVPTDLGLRPAQGLPDLIGSLACGITKTTELYGQAPSPYRRTPRGRHLSAFPVARANCGTSVPRAKGRMSATCSVFSVRVSLRLTIRPGPP